MKNRKAGSLGILFALICASLTFVEVAFADQFEVQAERPQNPDQNSGTQPPGPPPEGRPMMDPSQANSGNPPSRDEASRGYKNGNNSVQEN